MELTTQSGFDFNVRIFEKNQIQDLPKADLVNLAQMMSEFYAENGHDITRILAVSAKYQLLFAELEKAMKDKCVSEVEKYGKEKFSIHGVSLQVAEVGTRYDFSATKKWQDYQDQIDSIREDQKRVEALCKTLKEVMVQVDPETGESFEYYPPVKTSTTSIKKTIS